MSAEKDLERGEQQQIREGLLRQIFTALCALSLATGLILTWTGSDWPYATMAFALAYIFGSVFALPEAIRLLVKGHFSVDFLMIAAAIGAALLNRWGEGAVLLFLFSLSSTLEDFAMGRTRREIKSLMKIRPDEARVRVGDGEKSVRVEDLAIGDHVVVRPGERIPIDGEVITGHSEVDQSPITGESTPISKAVGDQVMSGTINQNGMLVVDVTKLARESILAKIIELVEQAQSERAPTERLIDQIGHYYTFAVIVGTALAFTVPYVLLREPFDPAFYRAMTLLVVSSPCALIISTPATILSAISNGARHGVLFKGGAYIEALGLTRVVAVDKTGTLTFGRPEVSKIIPCAKSQLAEAELLRIAASVEAYSEHPLAKAVVRAAERREIDITHAEQFSAIAGKGVRAHLDERQIWIGNHKFIRELGHDIAENLEHEGEALELQGQTVFWISDGTALGLIAVSDELRPNAKAVISELQSLGVEKIVMITGDNERVARSIAHEVGIEEVHANLLPDDKVDILHALKECYQHVVMVGDGVNDAPALATASVGVAMGGTGTDVALETADLVLMRDDLAQLAHAIKLSKRAKRILRQNLSFAGLVIVALIIATFAIQLPLPIGVVGHEGSTLLVVLNGLRLLR